MFGETASGKTSLGPFLSCKIYRESRGICLKIVVLYYTESIELKINVYIMIHGGGSFSGGLPISRNRANIITRFLSCLLLSQGQDHNGNNAYVCTINDRPI